VDLVLTDVVMPDMSGPELAGQLRAERPGVRMLFMSGYSGDVIAQSDLAEAGYSLLQKPFSPQQLGSAVRAALGEAPAKGRILVADDEEAVRSYFRIVLERGGYEVLEAADGRQAMRITLSTPVDLVITDLIMPEQEGLETIQALRRSGKPVRIVAVSGAVNGPFLSIAAKLGADTVLSKPVDADQLLATVKRVLQRQ
jgi:CheY-like chemotaxis protein